MVIAVIILSAAAVGAATLAVLWRNEAKLWEGVARAMSKAMDERCGFKGEQ